MSIPVGALSHQLSPKGPQVPRAKGSWVHIPGWQTLEEPVPDSFLPLRSSPGLGWFRNAWQVHQCLSAAGSLPSQLCDQRLLSRESALPQPRDHRLSLFICAYSAMRSAPDSHLINDYQLLDQLLSTTLCLQPQGCLRRGVRASGPSQERTWESGAFGLWPHPRGSSRISS